MDVVVLVVDNIVVGNVSGTVVTGDVGKVVIVVDKVVVSVDKVVVGKVVVGKVVVGKVVSGKVVVGKVVAGKSVVGKVVVAKVVVVVDIVVGVDAVTKPPSCPIPKKFRGEFGIFGSHRTGSLVNRQNLYHLTKKSGLFIKKNGNKSKYIGW